MLLLAADTSGKHGSIALAQCGPADECRVLEVVPLTGGTFSAQLVPQIAGLLEKHGYTKQDIAAFAVASGPGSFTGLRVGLAAIKALAEVLNKPIAAVSRLEVVAISARSHGKVLSALDAGRNEIFLGEYEIVDSGSQMIREWLVSPDELEDSIDGATLVTPDTNVLEAARAKSLPVLAVEHPHSDAIARLGWRKICAGQTISPAELEANYIRRSDAEIFAKSSS